MTGVTLGHPKAVYRERLECCTVEIAAAALNIGMGHLAGRHELLRHGVELEHWKADSRVRQVSV